MIEFHGRSLPTTLKELVDPRYTALVVVDVQNDFCAKGGVMQNHGIYMFRGNALIRKLRALIRIAKQNDVQIVYLQNTNLPDRMSDSAATLLWRMKMWGLDDPNLIPEYNLEGSWGQQIVEDIRPSDGDLVVKKNRSSGFIGTNLNLLLRSSNIKTLLVTGVVTQACVAATAHDAFYNDYFVVVLKDCCDSNSEDLHNAALRILETRLEVATSDDVIEIWKTFE